MILGDTYEVGRLLAYGGMGRIHVATHRRLPLRFAIKFLEPRLARDKLSFARFRREAEIASSLGNPHIAHVFDFNTLPDGSPYMVLELLEGQDLSDRLGEGSLSADECVQLSAHLASALTEAHARGVIHRDIKPENIFLCRGTDGEPFTAKVLDFGISKLRRSLASQTAAGALLGTPAYMSPEQAGGLTQLVDHRSDVYSMAAVLYEALSGERVHRGDNAYEILTEIATAEPRPLPGWPAEVDAVLQRGLARHPADRHQSAAALHHDLVRALTGRTTAAIAIPQAPVLPREPRATSTAKVDPIALTDIADVMPPPTPMGALVAAARRTGRLGFALTGLVGLLLLGAALSPDAPEATAASMITTAAPVIAHRPEPARVEPVRTEPVRAAIALHPPARCERTAAPMQAARAPAPVVRRTPRAAPLPQSARLLFDGREL